MKKISLSFIALFLLPSLAYAQDNAFHAGDWLLRARAVGVVPQVDSTVSGGTTVTIDNSLVPELDATYFFTPAIAAELIAAVTPHNLQTRSGIDAGSAWLLPPTLTLQYHFDQYSFFRPYVGAGINYTHFFNTDAGALNSVKYDDSVGPAFQAGVDIPFKDNWYFNMDVKKIYINTTAKFSPSGVRADVHIDPWLFGVGMGYRF